MIDLILLGLYSSYAIFVTKQLQENVVTVKLIDNPLTLKVNDIDNKEITIKGNTDNIFNLKISNMGRKMYYEIFHKSDREGLLVTKMDDNYKGVIDNSPVEAKVHVINKTEKDIKITFMVKSSFEEDFDKDIGYSYINEEDNFDHSHANTPNMNGLTLIPVIYEKTSDKDGSWIKADITNNESIWYDYDHLLWANAVLVSSSNYQKYLNKEIGTPIEMGDILGFYVWIPRFKYNIINSSNYISFERLNNVIFEKEKSTTGTVICKDKISNQEDTHIYSEVCSDIKYGKIYDNLSTFTHPAFRDDFGFWVSKFLMGDGNSKIKSMPNTNFLKKNIYDAIKLSNNVIEKRSHLLTNMEYASIVILTDSVYGKSNNSNYLDNNYTFKRVYNNNYLYEVTGCSTDYNNYSKGFSTSDSKTCVSYNDLTNYSHVSNSVKYNIYEVGPGASTTGTINGVYDMASIKGELVAGFTASIDGDIKINTSYYDIYSYNNYIGKIISSGTINNLYRYKLGDSIRESFRSIKDNGMWQGGLLEHTKEEGVILRGGNGNIKNASIYTASVVDFDTYAPFRVSIH